MNKLKTLGILGLGLAGASAIGDPIDFLHMPRHTVVLSASTIDGRPDSIRLRGYYLYRDGDRFVLLSHRPEGDHNQFFGSAVVDKGHFDTTGIVDQSSGDVLKSEDARLHWNLATHWEHVNGISFRVYDSRYVVFDLREDQGNGKLPAIFVGHNESKYQSGSGYVLVDLLK